MQNNAHNDHNQELSLLGFLLTLLKRKRLIFFGSLFYGVLVTSICLIMSPIFQATAQISPSQSSGTSATQLLSQLGGAAGMFLQSVFPTTSPSDFLVGVLQTEPVLNAVIDKHNLKKQFDVETYQEARTILMEKVFTIQPNSMNGIVSISAQDKDPILSAAMVNTAIESLVSLLSGLSLTEASKRRVFFEAELKKAYEQLGKSEDSLRDFQESSGMLKMDEQASALVQAIATLKAQIAAKEIQLKVMRSYTTDANPDFRKLVHEYDGLKEQLQKLLDKEREDNRTVIIPTGEIPSIGIEYIRRMREFKFHESLYEILIKQYEAARLDEAKEAPIAQVISRASVPELKAKPKILLLTFVGLALGFFISSFFAFVVEYFEKVSMDSSKANLLREMKIYSRRL